MTIWEVPVMVVLNAGMNGIAKLKLYCTFTFTTQPGLLTGLTHPAFVPGQVVVTVIALGSIPGGTFTVLR